MRMILSRQHKLIRFVFPCPTRSFLNSKFNLIWKSIFWWKIAGSWSFCFHNEKKFLNCKLKNNIFWFFMAWREQQIAKYQNMLFQSLVTNLEANSFKILKNVLRNFLCHKMQTFATKPTFYRFHDKSHKPCRIKHNL